MNIYACISFVMQSCQNTAEKAPDFAKGEDRGFLLFFTFPFTCSAVLKIGKNTLKSPYFLH